MIKLDEEGYPDVTVADIVAFLLTLPQDAHVFLNHDGWMETETKPTTMHELIVRRGVFDYDTKYGLCINN